MRKTPEQQIFRAGSKTYYWSAKFFPKAVRQDVYKLYSFVRVADDYVDAQPAQPEEFYNLRALYNDARAGKLLDPTVSINSRVAHNMANLVVRYQFDPAWVDDFLDAMESDLRPSPYQTLDDTLHYVYGSAEVIGLMMARIMGLSEEAAAAARMQGRAMQWINFIRDIAEDNSLGRQYFPKEDLKKFKLNNITERTAVDRPEAYAQFVCAQLQQYQTWQAEAAKGYGYLPDSTRIAVQTAALVYEQTAKQIAQDPLIVFNKKIRPSKYHIILTGIKFTVRSFSHNR